MPDSLQRSGHCDVASLTGEGIAAQYLIGIIPTWHSVGDDNHSESSTPQTSPYRGFVCRPYVLEDGQVSGERSTLCIGFDSGITLIGRVQLAQMGHILYISQVQFVQQ